MWRHPPILTVWLAPGAEVVVVSSEDEEEEEEPEARPRKRKARPPSSPLADAEKTNPRKQRTAPAAGTPSREKRDSGAAEGEGAASADRSSAPAEETKPSKGDLTASKTAEGGAKAAKGGATKGVSSGGKKKVVFSGVFEYGRNEIEALARGSGFRVTSAISGQTTYLVAGSKLEDGREVRDGSKYRKATELVEKKKSNIRIIDEAEFLSLANADSKKPLSGTLMTPEQADTCEEDFLTKVEASKPETKG
eukprot:GHVU01127505.1.p1 GENE.GHVU01127505.1~~GHVU01127505.1.p1  ORF type:complete len:250 (+),score=46.80 GHVU01127505.1:703-1452(+)